MGISPLFDLFSTCLLEVSPPILWTFHGRQTDSGPGHLLVPVLVMLVPRHSLHQLPEVDPRQFLLIGHVVFFLNSTPVL